MENTRSTEETGGGRIVDRVVLISDVLLLLLHCSVLLRGSIVSILNNKQDGIIMRDIDGGNIVCRRVNSQNNNDVVLFTFTIIILQYNHVLSRIFFSFLGCVLVSMYNG